MAGFMDILLALVQVLCGGGSTKTEEPPQAKYQEPRVEQQRTTAHLERPQEREPKPLLQPRSEHRPRQDKNQDNQHDEHYLALRAKANEHGDTMARCFQESHEAYDQGDHARAKELSGQGKQHERMMESLNAEASAWIFQQNNLDSKPGEVDLHGLYVKEAVSYADRCIQEARGRGDAEVRLIVGKGLHSDGHVAKIKPAIEDLLKKYSIPADIDPRNAGVLVARLS